MSQPTSNEVQAVDPVLTNMLVGYKQAADRFVAGRVFPIVPVEKRGFTYYIFTKKYWFIDSLKARAEGGQFARGGYGVESTTGNAQLWGLEHTVADEARANNQAPMALEQAGLQWLAQQSLIRRERAFAADFMTTSVWGTDDNNSATDWDDFSAGDPIDNVLTARRTVSNNTGMDPNTMVLGYIVHQALVNHPDIIDRVKYVQVATLATVESALASAFGVSSYLVGKASYNSANEGQSMTAAAILDDDCLVCHCAGSAAGIMTASCGYTFAWTGGGGDGAIVTYREQPTKSDVLQLSEAWDQKAVATDLGYFFSDIV
jgi:hypothetical protein